MVVQKVTVQLINVFIAITFIMSFRAFWEEKKKKEKQEEKKRTNPIILFCICQGLCKHHESFHDFIFHLTLSSSLGIAILF